MSPDLPLRGSPVKPRFVSYLLEPKGHHMPTQRRSLRTSRLHERIGDMGWRATECFTFGARSSAQLPVDRTNTLLIGCGTGELERRLSELRHNVVGVAPSWTHAGMIIKAETAKAEIRDNVAAKLSHRDLLPIAFQRKVNSVFTSL